MENAIRMRILQAARDLFNSRGYRNVTIQDLAEKLGISKKTIYQYFTSKEEIAAEYVEETIERMDHVIDVTKLSQSDPIMVVKEILLNVKNESTRFSTLFLIDMEKYLPEVASRYNELRSRGYSAITCLLQDAQNRGYVRNIPLPLTTEVLSVCINALIMSEKRSATDEALNLFLDIFCNGIMSGPSIQVEQ